MLSCFCLRYIFVITVQRTWIVWCFDVVLRMFKSRFYVRIDLKHTHTHISSLSKTNATPSRLYCSSRSRSVFSPVSPSRFGAFVNLGSFQAFNFLALRVEGARTRKRNGLPMLLGYIWEWMDLFEFLLQKNTHVETDRPKI